MYSESESSGLDRAGTESSVVVGVGPRLDSDGGGGAVLGRSGSRAVNRVLKYNKFIMAQLEEKLLLIQY